MMVVIGPLVGLMVMAVVTYVIPKRYESEAVVEVKPMAVMQEDGSLQKGLATPQFFGTEYEVIKSHKVLEEVVGDLSLINRWNMDQESCIRILKGIITCQNIHGTDLIILRVRHTNKVDARDLVEDVVRVYQKNRHAAQQQKIEDRIQQLNQAVTDQDAKLTEMRKKWLAVAESERSGVDYQNSLSQLKASEELLKALKLKQVAMSMEKKIPSDLVQVHEAPVIAEAPVSPNVTINLILGVIAGLLLSPVLALLVIALMSMGQRNKPLSGLPSRDAQAV